MTDDSTVSPSSSSPPPTTNQHARTQKGETRGGSFSKRAPRQGYGKGGGNTPRKPAKPRKTLNTIAFDSAGPRKYAIQLQEASNGNPCLKIIEGIPQEDGSHRKVYLTVWSEDFESFFKAMGDTYRFIKDQDIATPKGHKTPKTMGKKKNKKK